MVKRIICFKLREDVRARLERLVTRQGVVKGVGDSGLWKKKVHESGKID